MSTRKTPKPELTTKVRVTLTKEPGLSVKDLAERLSVNRQFMAGVLAILEEHKEVSHRQVGPARIYFSTAQREQGSGGSRQT